MDFFQAIFHLLNFLAPAAFLAAAMVLVGLFWRKKPALPSKKWAQFTVIFAVNTALLIAGLLVFGRDAKMVTYAALVLASATSLFVIFRLWK
jgi:hypothetical protein